jgi:hypothetical protein
MTQEMTEMHANDENRQRPTAAQRIKEAEDVRDELWAVLHGAGIVLPSLNVDPLAYVDEDPRPLVELGRCNVRTARALVSVVRKGANPV